MRPYNAHLYRTALGMAHTAETLLDMIAYYTETGALSVAEIRRIAHRDKVASNATSFKFIHWLIDNKYVTQKPSKTDRRLTELELTAKGAKYLAKIHAADSTT